MFVQLLRNFAGRCKMAYR